MTGIRQQRDAVLDAPGVLQLTDVSTFDAFYLREMPSLILLARALSGPAYAEDIAQEAMLTAYRHWSEVSQYASPVGWVRRVCANRAVSTLRRRSVEARALLRLTVPTSHLDDSPAEVEEFWAHVRQLPRRQAQSVALYYLYDLSVAEIADTLECSTGSVKVHLSRGRAALAKQFREPSETDDEVEQ
jgi:RNA polymerase sigma factor (sigma-70 family)